ncbi:hypothetical protein MNBD_GAMMA21-1404 [hydrothermal vent metagenome]|uniref:Uncharacterized protein n=1 Tax=hydrothermal vent metagenome TaxID=652676 RepID=A0A3B1AFT0_9ZZZZ
MNDYISDDSFRIELMKKAAEDAGMLLSFTVMEVLESNYEITSQAVTADQFYRVAAQNYQTLMLRHSMDLLIDQVTGLVNLQRASQDG